MKSHSPEILLSDDLNLPSITWSDGGIVNSCPTYGHGINELFLDTVNEYGLEQLIIQPTRGKNILDLVFSDSTKTISNLQIIPGISDHEAIFFHLGLEQDYLQLQQDLQTVYEWSQKWQMCFNISKCVALRCCRMLSPSLFTYVLNDQPISCVDQHPYLGVILTSNMSFSPHIQKIAAKATRVLNFIKRNLYNCSKEIKSKAYTLP